MFAFTALIALILSLSAIRGFWAIYWTLISRLPFYRSTSLTSLASPTINSTTSAFLSNLVASPSLLSLQQAYKNPDLGSQELGILEGRRIEVNELYEKIQ